jgi:hypothetical protein
MGGGSSARGFGGGSSTGGRNSGGWSGWRSGGNVSRAIADRRWHTFGGGRGGVGSALTRVRDSVASAVRLAGMAGAVVAGVAGAVLGVFLVSAGEVAGAAVGVLVLGVGLSGVGRPIGITRGKLL